MWLGVHNARGARSVRRERHVVPRLDQDDVEKGERPARRDGAAMKLRRGERVTVTMKRVKIKTAHTHTWNSDVEFVRCQFVFRLPPPFYRTQDHKIVAGPGATPVVFARLNDCGALGVLGWIVERGGDVFGYVRYKQSPDFDGIKRIAFAMDEEGITWARGWDMNSEALRALIAAVALR